MPSSVNIILPTGDEALAARVVEALHAYPPTRTGIEAAGGTAPGKPRYVVLSRLGGQAPPAGVPFLNADLGVLSVPAPAEGVSAVEAAVRGVAPGIQVEPEATYSIDMGPEAG